MDNKKSINIKRLKILLFIAFAVAFSTPNYSQYQLSALAARVMAELSLNPVQFNSIFTAPMIPALFLSMISGILVDKYGFKYVIGASIVISFIGIAMRAFATNYAQLFIAMMMLGLSGGILSANTAKVIGSVFESHKVGVIVGYGITCSTTTMFLSMATTALMTTKVAFTIAAVFALIDVIIWFALTPNKKVTDAIAKDIAVDASAADVEKVSAKECLKVVLKNKYVWLVSIGLFFVNGAMIGMNSLISAALISRGMTETAAGAVGAFVLLGNLLGSLIIPSLAAKTGKFRLILAIMSIIAAVGTSFSWLAPEGIILDAALLLTGLGVGSVLPQLLAVNVALPGIGPKYAGTAGGVTVTCELIGAICIPTYIASTIATIGGVTNYYVYFIICGAGMLLCALAMMLLPKAVDKNISGK